jgi:hypothetical protein
MFRVRIIGGEARGVKREEERGASRASATQRAAEGAGAPGVVATRHAVATAPVDSRYRREFPASAAVAARVPEPIAVPRVTPGLEV